MYDVAYVRCNLPRLKSKYICVIECRKKIHNGERGARFENVETADGREGILNVPIVMYITDHPGITLPRTFSCYE